MIQIDEQIINALCIDSYAQTMRYKSRRNEVYKIEALRKDGTPLCFVYKRFHCGSFEKERSALRAAEGMACPRVLATGENAYALSYIPGTLLIDVLAEEENANRSFTPFADALLRFLQSFYAAFPGYIYGDVNFRNFIATDSGIYGLDLEDVKAGEIQTDMGRIAAFLLTYAPEFTAYKRHAAQCFIEAAVRRFGIVKQDIRKETEAELHAIKQRRGGLERQHTITMTENAL